MTAIQSVKLSPGGQVDLINISNAGALVEGRTRLLPGTGIVFRVTGTVRQEHVKGRVLRCQVSTIDRDGSLRYQCAIAFDETFEFDEPGSADAIPARVNPLPVAPLDVILALSPPRVADQPSRVVNQW